MKEGSTHLAHKPEHAVDLDTGAVIAAEIHPTDGGDTTTLPDTLEAAAANLAKDDWTPTTAEPAELVADNGCHARAVLKDLVGSVWKTRIAEPLRSSLLRGHGDTEAQDAVPHQPQQAALRRWQGGDAKTRRDRRALVCSHSRTWLHAPDLAARPRKTSISAT